MKKFIAIILSAAVFFCIRLPVASAADEPGYEYTIIDNQATITGYRGDPVYIEIPETIEGCRVTELRDNAFYECGSLRHISLPEGLKKIGHHCFYACFSLESISLPDSVTELGMGCFCGCSELSSVRISEELTVLPESCFRACTSLMTVTIPESVKSIGDFCFSGCTSLKDVSLGDSIASLGDCAFFMCSSMEGLYIPPAVSDIGICAAGYVPGDDGAVPAEGFTVMGEKKSAAEAYAKDNGIDFTNVSDHVHAFAIQRVNGQRIPVSIPSVLLIGTAVLLASAAVFKRRKKRRTFSLKNKNN